MKIKFLPFVTSIIILVGILTSCLDNDVQEVTYTAESSITSFSIGTLAVDVMGVDRNGNDSAYVDSLDASVYPFTINQITRVIENKDSLPVGTHIDKVLADIDSDTGYIFYVRKDSEGDAGRDTLWTSTDSLNFTYGPIEFKVLAYTGTYGYPYTVKINVHQQNPDSLMWSQPFDRQFASGTLSKQKAVHVDGKIFVFGQTTDGIATVEYTSLSYQLSGTIATQADPSPWQRVDLPEGTDTYSPVLWQNHIYFLANQVLYVMDPISATYEVASLNNTPANLSQLLVGVETSSNAFLYGYTSEGIYTYYDMDAGQWMNDESDNNFIIHDDYRVISAVVPVSYNSNLKRLVTISQNSVAADSSAIVGTRLTNDGGWRVLKTSVDSLSCPNIVDPTLIYYNKRLYAFGGKAVNNTYSYDAFTKLFVSVDNGLTWEPIATGATFPKDNAAFLAHYDVETKGGYSSAVDEQNFIWIIWTDGTLSRGRINHLGFQSKW